MIEVALVACSATKASRAAPARELYTSQLFKRSLAYATRRAPGNTWIISARYALLALDQVVEPYDLTLNMSSKERRALWGVRVVDQLLEVYDRTAQVELVLLAGEMYTVPIRVAATRIGWQTVEPLRGMQIGQRLHWLTQQSLLSPRERMQAGERVPLAELARGHGGGDYIKPADSRYYQLREPYVHQHQSPLGWVVELVDPQLPPGKQLVQTVHPPRKWTRRDKDALIRAYKERRQS